MAYKLQNFLAETGGLLALFIGASLLSIVEIFYFLIGGCMAQRRTPPKSLDFNVIQANCQKVDMQTSVAYFEKQLQLNNLKLGAIMRSVDEVELSMKENCKTIKK